MVEVNTENPDILQEGQKNVPFFGLKVKMEVAYSSETFYLAINKGISDSFWGILMIHLYPSSSDLCKNLMEFSNGLRIILHGTFSFPYIYSEGKNPKTIVLSF